MEKASTIVGLDVHKESIDVTIAEAGAAGEVLVATGSPRAATHLGKRRKTPHKGRRYD